jgi:hypothetical protein
MLEIIELFLAAIAVSIFVNFGCERLIAHEMRALKRRLRSRAREAQMRRQQEPASNRLTRYARSPVDCPPVTL